MDKKIAKRGDRSCDVVKFRVPWSSCWVTGQAWVAMEEFCYRVVFRMMENGGVCLEIGSTFQAEGRTLVLLQEQEKALKLLGLKKKK